MRLEVSDVAWGLLADSIMRDRPTPLQLLKDLDIPDVDPEPCHCCDHPDEFGVFDPCPVCEERAEHEAAEKQRRYDGVWKPQP